MICITHTEAIEYTIKHTLCQRPKWKELRTSTLLSIAKQTEKHNEIEQKKQQSAFDKSTY